MILLSQRLQRLLLLTATATCATGCINLPQRIVEPRSVQVLDADFLQQFNRQVGAERHSLVTADGVALSYLTLPAARRNLSYSFERTDHSMHSNFKVEGEPQLRDIRGTIMWLHGWNLDATSMLPWALQMSELGYQSVLPDLRNHGLSARAPAGYGVREADDLLALVDELQQQGQLETPLYLFGVSYGAVTSLFAEPKLRDRVAGIVALEPYANAADAIHDMAVAATDPAQTSTWRRRLLRRYLRRQLDSAQVDRAIASAGQTLSLDLLQVDVTGAVTQSGTCILLVHGTEDRIVPVQVARKLATAGDRITYVELVEENHFSLPLRLDWLAAPIADWLQALQSGTDCKDFRLPEDPLRSPVNPQDDSAS